MQTDVITGACGYSGAAIARELRAAGHQVRTLTGHPRGGPDAGDIDTRPLDFSDPEALVKDLAGAHTLYCTYWVRVPYAIARPSILFGSSADHGAAASVLVNNIAWLLRRLPVFGLGDGGGYRIRPIHVDDLARLCVELGGRGDNVTIDAVGPDSPTFREMVTAIR